MSSDDDPESIFELTTVWTLECSAPLLTAETSTESCLPPHFSSIWTHSGYYSPGICFSGYTPGCSVTWRGDFEPEVNAVNCVPSGYSCDEDFYATSIIDDDETTSVPAFEIQWRDSDLSLLETHPLTPGATITDSSSGTSSGSATELIPTSSEEPKPENNGVSTGAVVGIAIGVAVFVAALSAAGFVWYRKRHNYSGIVPGTPTEDKPSGRVVSTGPSEPGVSSSDGALRGTGAGMDAPIELAAGHYYTTDGAAELHGRDLLPELPHAGVNYSGTGGGSSDFQVRRKPTSAG